MDKNNGLKLKQISSSAITFDSFTLNDENSVIEVLTKYFKDDGTVVVYLDYKIIIGLFSDGQLVFYNNEKFKPKFIQKIRLFNEDKELYIWRLEEDLFSSRLRVDGKGDNTDVVEADQVIWGTDYKKETAGWTKIFEKRGTKLYIPIENLQVDNKRKKLKIKTHNYIAYNGLGQAGYVDARFVNFFEGGE